MSKRHDHTGKRFGKLVALAAMPVRMRGQIAWLCICDCGKEHVVPSYHLAKGQTTSCGCHGRAILGKNSVTHGDSKSPEYITWTCLRGRCLNPRNKKYPSYGGRGIKVCERWNRFENFLADMGRRPSPQHSIDRKDNDGDYSPENCRWATLETQANNKRVNRSITIGSETLNASQWERRMGFKPDIIHSRLTRGWTPERAVTTPTSKSHANH